MRTTAVTKAGARLLLAAGLLGGAAACGGGDKAATPTTTTVAGGSGAGGSTTTTAGATGGTGGTTTTAAGSAAGVQAGGVGYFKAFKYTVKSGTLSPATEADKQVLKVVLEWENVSKGQHPAVGNFAEFKLDGDEFQRAEDAKATPSGQVPAATKGTTEVTFEVGRSFDVSKVSIVIGSDENRENPILPLGSGGKKETREAKDSSIGVTVSGATRNGVSFTGTKATLASALSHNNEQAEKGKAFLLVTGQLKGASEQVQLGFSDVKIKQPDGTIANLEGYVVSDKLETSVLISAGQTKDVQLVVVLEDRSKSSGGYEVQIVPENGSTFITGAFTIS